MTAWESACGPQWPTVEQPQPRWGRSAAMVARRTLGQNNSLSPSLAHLSHTTTITLSRIKCERLYFYKEVCLFVHWSSSLCLIISRIYLYYGYTTYSYLVPKASSCPHGMISNLHWPRRSKKRPIKILNLEERRETKGESETECNTSNMNETRIGWRKMER